MNSNEISLALLNLAPKAEWSLSGDKYEDIVWLSEGNAPTLSEIESEIALLPQKAAEAEATKASDKTALLAKLGITAEEAALLLS
jgi:hypothetical protein